MTHQIDVVVWANVWELALSWWRVIRLRRLVFLISWKKTGKQIVVYHSELTILRCTSGTIATWPVFRKNMRSFAWKCFVCKQLLLDLAHLRLLFTFGLICVNPRFIICHDVIDVFLEHFFQPIDTSFFFERLTNCVGSNANKFFWQSNVHAILNVCWSR